MPAMPMILFMLFDLRGPPIVGGWAPVRDRPLLLSGSRRAMACRGPAVLSLLWGLPALVIWMKSLLVGLMRFWSMISQKPWLVRQVTVLFGRGHGTDCRTAL